MSELGRFFPTAHFPLFKYDAKIASILHSEETQYELEKDMKRRKEFNRQDTVGNICDVMDSFQKNSQKLQEEAATLEKKMRKKIEMQMSQTPSATLNTLSEYRESLVSERKSTKRKHTESNISCEMKSDQSIAKTVSDPSVTAVGTGVAATTEKSFFLRVGERMYKYRLHEDKVRSEALQKVIKELKKQPKDCPSSMDYEKLLDWAEEGYVEYILAYFITVKHMCAGRKRHLVKKSEKRTFEEAKLIAMIADDMAKMATIEKHLQNVPREDF